MGGGVAGEGTRYRVIGRTPTSTEYIAGDSCPAANVTGGWVQALNATMRMDQALYNSEAIMEVQADR